MHMYLRYTVIADYYFKGIVSREKSCQKMLQISNYEVLCVIGWNFAKYCIVLWTFSCFDIWKMCHIYVRHQASWSSVNLADFAAQRISERFFRPPTCCVRGPCRPPPGLCFSPPFLFSQICGHLLHLHFRDSFMMIFIDIKLMSSMDLKPGYVLVECLELRICENF